MKYQTDRGVCVRGVSLQVVAVSLMTVLRSGSAPALVGLAWCSHHCSADQVETRWRRNR